MEEKTFVVNGWVEMELISQLFEEKKHGGPEVLVFLADERLEPLRNFAKFLSDIFFINFF